MNTWIRLTMDKKQYQSLLNKQKKPKPVKSDEGHKTKALTN